MALLYPWATKEYLLRNMTIGQIIMYLNLGLEIKYPQPEKEGAQSKSVRTAKEARELKQKLRDMYGEV